MDSMMPGIFVVIWALFHCGVSGVPVPVDRIPIIPIHSSDASPSSSPITITTSGNMSGWVDQLALGQAFPLESFGANLSDQGPLEVHINIYDFRVSNEPTKANPSISYFTEDDTSDYSSSSEESSSEEGDATLAELFFGPDETDARLHYGLIDSKAEGTDTDSNKPETSLSYLPLEAQLKLKKAATSSAAHATTNAAPKEPMKLSIEDLDEMTRMYTGMALCTRIIKYMTMLDGSNKLGTRSDISVDALTYFSNLFNCLTTNNVFSEDARSSMEPHPTASPPSLNPFDKLQMMIPDPPTSTTEETTMEPATIGIIFTSDDDDDEVEQEYVGGEMKVVQDQPAQFAFLTSQDEKESSPVEDSPHFESAAATAAPVSKNDEGLSETDDKPIEDFDEEYPDERGFTDDEAMGVYILAVIVTLFFVFAFVAGMFYDNVLWRKIMKLRGTETDVNANECNKKGDPIWLVLKKREVGGGDQKREHPSLLINWV